MSCGKSQSLPYQLVNLMELLEMYAGSYWRISGMIGQLVCHLEAGTHGITLTMKVYQEIGNTLVEIRNEMQKLGLKGPVNQVQRLVESLDNSSDQAINATLRQRI